MAGATLDVSRKGLIEALVILLVLAATPSFAQPLHATDTPAVSLSADTDSNDDEWESFDESDSDELLDLSLEELMEIEVTLVSGSKQSWWMSPAAVFVLTAEEIRRAGHTSVMEALRMVPGIDVAQLSANVYAISVRGYRERFANKLLVLVDGRTIYNDSYGGVEWDTLSVSVDDIDRIEVIRGPGSTIWGANAVNGVINIITRRANAGDGHHLSAGSGSQQRFLGVGSSTLPVFERGAVRFTLSGSDFDSFEQRAGGNARDDWRSHRLLMRYDHDLSDDLAVTLLSGHYDVYRGEVLRQLDLTTPPFLLPLVQNTTTRGEYVLGRLEATGEEQRTWSLQAYWDKNRIHSDGLYEEQTFDLEFRQHLSLGTHLVTWGTGYRRREDSLVSTGTLLRFVPSRKESDKYSLFVQDAFSVCNDRLQVIVGTKVEKNDYSGIEWQPSVRLSYPMTPSTLLWGAISRAVHTPVRSDEGVVINVAVATPPSVPSPTAVTLVGNGALDAENLIAYEAGLRHRLGDHSSVDVAVFYNSYDDLIERTTTANPLVFTLSNDNRGLAYGVEVTGNLQLTKRWEMASYYAFTRLRLHGTEDGAEDGSPAHHAHLRSSYRLRENLDLHIASYFVDRTVDPEVRSYVRTDAGITWRPAEGLELSCWGYNLADRDHLEGLDQFRQATQNAIPRSFFIQMSWDF